MNKIPSRKWWGPALAGSLALAATAAPASPVWMDGEVTLDYYVADVDPDGYELTDAEIYVERVVNDGSGGSGPLSLSGWLTSDPSAAGAGMEAGTLPIGSLPGRSSLEVWDTVPAEDATPGEYYVHMLLQNDNFPGTFEDTRSLSPRLLWRGGLEAVGPLQIFSESSGRATVDFAELRDNRLDARYTNDILLTLYATYGFGPASEGHVLCRITVPGLYAGDWRYDPGFDCWPNAIPDGEYTLHLEVAESGGRGGASTLSGPNLYFRGGYIDEGYDSGCCYTEVYAAGLSWWALLPLLFVAGWKTIAPMGRSYENNRGRDCVGARITPSAAAPG